MKIGTFTNTKNNREEKIEDDQKKKDSKMISAVESDLKLHSFKIGDFLSFLSWTGIVASIFMIIISLYPVSVFVENSLLIRDYSIGPADSYMIAFGFISFFLSLVWLCYNNHLRSSVKKDDDYAAAYYLKYLCFIQVLVEVIIYGHILAAFIYTYLANLHSPGDIGAGIAQLYSIVGMGLASTFLASVLCFKVVGLLSRSPKLIQAYLILSFILMILLTIGLILICGAAVLMFKKAYFVILGLAQIVVNVCFFIYWNGYIMSAHCIMKNREQYYNPQPDNKADQSDDLVEDDVNDDEKKVQDKDYNPDETEETPTVTVTSIYPKLYPKLAIGEETGIV